ncbi:hypothetical protein CUMW_094390 [Citrus unshiu]|uniref:Glycoside hydrolase family 19 catalytic domain-containing protein n=1 Tax=Citrus unshiu TaxID=55188 RepID=A0A2H5P170_CITUN|nr:hypothetical protein CUMW_094390 [Citrus unshiu]
MRLIGSLLIFSLVLSFVLGGSAQNCGSGVVCGERDTGHGTDGGELGKIISREMFEDLLPYRNDARCPARGFYTYDAFIEAAQAFPGFGNSGNETMRKREIAAFFAQTGHETTGLFQFLISLIKFKDSFFRCTNNPQPDYCDPNYPCRGKNYNYLRCGEDLGLGEELLNNPDLLATDPVLSFKSAIWFWMTAQPPKPSCHEVIIDEWKPSANDVNAGRLPGYGLTTNIINGGIECGHGGNAAVRNRIGFFTTFCGKFGIQPGDNLDCSNQRPYGLNLMAQSM